MATKGQQVKYLLKDCSSDDLGLTLTPFKARSNVVIRANVSCLYKFKKMLSTRGQVILVALYQDSHILTIPSISAKAARPIITKVSVEASAAEGTKLYTWQTSYISSMTAITMYHKNLLKSLFVGINRPMALELDVQLRVSDQVLPRLFN